MGEEGSGREFSWEEGGEYLDENDASKLFASDSMMSCCPAEDSNPDNSSKIVMQEQNASLSSTGGITCQELDAWIRDEPTDSISDSSSFLQALPQVPEEEDKQRLGDDDQRQQAFLYPDVCRSDSTNQESCLIDSPLEEMRVDVLPPLTETRSSGQSNCTFPDLRKIIVKKPIMDKAVERLGGGRKGAVRLWNIIQVWLKHQQQQQQQHASGLAFDDDSMPYRNMDDLAFLHGMQFPFYSNNSDDNSSYYSQHAAGLHPSADGLFSGYGQNAYSLSEADVTAAAAMQQQQQQQQQHSYVYMNGGSSIQGPSQSPLDCGHMLRPMSPAASTRAARKSRMARQRKHAPRVSASSSSSVSWSSLASSPAPSRDYHHHQQQQQQQQQQQLQQQQQQQLRNYPPPYARDINAKGRTNNDKNVKFLLQKELKPSDVGNLGRIVLPKKEAEVHLPYLAAREGITMAMEDMVTSHTWHFRYRFWPNNKSRMYLLESTGEFIKSHSLKEGDVLQIYKDWKNGKHLIFGRKIARPEVPNAGGLMRRELVSKSPGAEKSEAESVSGATSISSTATFSDSSKETTADHLGGASKIRESRRMEMEMEVASMEAPNDENDGLDPFPSLELGDEFIEEIMGLVDAPESERHTDKQGEEADDEKEDEEEDEEAS